MARYSHPAYQRQWAPEWDTPEVPTYYGHRRGGRLALWAVLMASAFILAIGWVFGHDHTTGGFLSVRGWATLALVVLVIVLLSVHRSYGPLPLARAIAEYAAVALLAVLLATAGTHPKATPRSTQASAGRLCPAVVHAVAGGLCDRLDHLWHPTHQQANQRGRPSVTTRPRNGHAMAPSPTLPTTPSTRRTRSS